MVKFFVDMKCTSKSYRAQKLEVYMEYFIIKKAKF